MLAVPFAQVIVTLFLSSFVMNSTGWVGSPLNELVNKTAGTAILPPSLTSSIVNIVLRVVSWSEAVIVRLLFSSNSKRKSSRIGIGGFGRITLDTDNNACKKSVLVVVNLMIC